MTFNVFGGTLSLTQSINQSIIFPSYNSLRMINTLCTAPWSGTPCWTTSAHSRTISRLDRAWKPGFSLDTSEFSELEIMWQLALYKFIHLPYHTIPYQVVVWHSGSALVSINEVNLHRARLKLGRVTMSGLNIHCGSFISVCNQSPRST